jgi:hypothetical protein
MSPFSQRNETVSSEAAPFLSRRQARGRALSPSTAWEAPCASTLRYLTRQQRRAETELHLEAAIVQDERGWLALWTRER